MAAVVHTTSTLRRWTTCAVLSATMLGDLPRADHRRPWLGPATDAACRRAYVLDSAQAPAGTDRGVIDAGAPRAAPPAAAVSHAARSPHRERSHPIFGL